jgi:hypothetical protein
VLVAAGGIGVAVAVVPQAITATRRKTTTPNPKVFDGSKALLRNIIAFNRL